MHQFLPIVNSTWSWSCSFFSVLRMCWKKKNITFEVNTLGTQETRQYLIWDKEGEEDTVDEVATSLFEAAEKDDDDHRGRPTTKGKRKKDKKKTKKSKDQKDKKKRKKKRSSSSSEKSSISSSSRSSSGGSKSRSSSSTSQAGVMVDKQYIKSMFPIYFELNINLKS